MFSDRRSTRRRRSSDSLPPDDASQRQIEEFRATIERQQKEIAALELTIARNNRLMKQTRQQITRLLRDCDETSRPRVQKLLDSVSEATTPSTSRRTFDEWLDQSKRAFIRRLSSRFPMLTPTELKICSLLQLNLRTREIAGLLRTSVRNIESHRYWIRKKLSIPSSTNLSTFLTGV